MKKKALSLLLALIMVFSVLPVNAMATDGEGIVNLVENIEFRSDTDPSKGVAYFSSFTPEQNEYDVAVASNYTMAKYFSIFLTTSSEEQLKYSFEIAKTDGTVAASGSGDITSKNFLLSPTKSALATLLPLGEERVLTISVFKADNESTKESYAFHITRVMALSTLIVKDDTGTNVALTPIFNQFDCAYIRSFTAESKAASITISSVAANGKVYVGETEIPRTGLTVDLSDEKFATDENGVYVPISVVSTNKLLRSDYTLYVSRGVVHEFEITAPTEAVFDKNEADAKISISHTLPEGAATLKWYQSQVKMTNLRKLIDGATECELQIDTSKAVNMYYQCVVTETATGLEKASDWISVSVLPGKPNAPVFYYDDSTFTMPRDENESEAPAYKTDYVEGEALHQLLVLAGTDEPGFVEFEYEWFYNTENSYEGAKSLSVQRFDDYIRDRDGYRFAPLHFSMPERLPAGEHYLFCAIRTVLKEQYATGNPEYDETEVRTAILKITVTPKDKIAGFEGAGIENDPYLIKTADQLKQMAALVDSGDKLTGVWFKFAADITLPDDWDPLGKAIIDHFNDKGMASSGRGSIQFEGFIDGDGHTLTIPDGGRPLLEFTREALAKHVCC